MAPDPSLTPEGSDPAVPPSITPPIADILLGWPGPALRANAAGDALCENDVSRELAAADPTWRGGLLHWVATGGSLREATRSLPVALPTGPGALEFCAVNMPDGDVLLLGRDVTLERRLRQALTESRQRYKDLVEISSDFAWEVDADDRFIFVSPSGAIGYTPDELIGRHPRELVLPEFADQPLPFATDTPIERTEIWLRARDGLPACLISSAVPLVGRDGTRIGARGACRDITEARLRGMELAQVRLREKYLGYIVTSTRDDVDPNKTLAIAAGVAVNATGALGARVFARAGDGFAVAHSQGEPPPAVAALVPDLLERAAEIEDPVSDTVDGIALLAGRTLFRHEVNGAVLVWRHSGVAWAEDDISMLRAVGDHVGLAVAQARYQERLKTLSERDGLTGLFNRRTFLELLEQRLARTSGGHSALLYFDLDNFKAVNDLLGHAAGDDVLRVVGGLLTRLARPGDLAGRLGGDEFVLWIDRVDRDQATRVAQRLLTEAADLMRTMSAAPEKPLGVSVGVALHRGGTGETVDHLVERADNGMYASKRRGKGNMSLAPDFEGAH